MTTSLVDRNSPTAYVGLLITIAAVFVLPLPPVLSIGIAAFGFLLTMLQGRSILRLLAGGLVGLSLFTLVVSNAANPDAPDLEEPIPVPSGYGFTLDPDSTNREHMYNSQPMSPKRARLAAVEVADHYVTALEPEWTVIDEDQRPDLSLVELREGDSSRGISIFVGVVTPLGQPAALDLRIQALVCSEELAGLAPGDVTCMTAPIRDIVSYPDGEPVVPSPHPTPGPLREPVPVPPGYGFSLDTGLSSEEMHAYRSAVMSIRESNRARRSVLRYYQRVLDDWTVVYRDTANLLIEAPDSTDGLAITSTVTGGEVNLEIRAITCLEDGWCSWRPLGA